MNIWIPAFERSPSDPSAGGAKVLAISGSTRKGSYNSKLLKIAAEMTRQAGAEVTLLDLEQYPLPIMNEDLEKEKGVPENAMKLKQLFISHKGLLIASPEYNSSITALLKNTIDWVSRPVPNEAPLAGFQGKVATLISASPGALGGLRGLVHLRSILGNIGVIVLPEQVALTNAHEAFADDGTLKDPKAAARLKKAMDAFAAVVRKVHG
ncbi:MAG: NAD(P)H-dependent oxidoreductase [Phycisphaerales bacterium]|nr:NAD(P)H-dependent oxidoreductase [Planctomycetota bacterium]